MSIDQRVVEMEFNNKAFGTGISKTLGDLDKLKSGLKLDGVSKGLEDANAAANRFSLSKIADGIETISSRFTTMGIVGVTAITNIANRAVNAGLQMAKSLTIAPISAGFSEYELKMGSIQTILSNTARYGTKLGDVNKALDELNTYADKTIYNFGDMTKNIGLFTNAGIKLEDATSMIKGFSNEAAASGTSAEGAAGAAYQLSQALSAGTIRLMDWRSLQNVGMGNKNMQNGIIEIASAMGTFSKHGTTATAAQKDFNGSLEKGWLSSEVMSNYLKIQAGDMDAAGMAALGLSDKQIKAFQAQAKMSEDAATKVRTFTQLIGTMREAVGSGWSETFGIVFGNFDEATDVFTSLNDVLGGFIQHSAEARNKVLADWKALNGRQNLILGIQFAFRALMGVLKPLADAFREIFPRKTGADLAAMTLAFRNFMANLIPAPATIDNLRRTFAGVFAILDIGWQIIKQGISLFFDLFGTLTEGSGGFLKTTASIGDFLVALDKAVKNGTGLTKFFHGLGTVLKVPINLIKGLAGFLGSLFENLNIDKASGTVDKLRASLSPLGKIGNAIAGAWGVISQIFSNVWNAFLPLGNKLADWFGNFGTMIADGLSTINFDDIIRIIQTGLFGGLVLTLKDLAGRFGKGEEAGGGLLQGIKDLVDGIKETFGQLTETLKAMQNALNAATLLQIAAAVGVLTYSVVSLSRIDAAGLSRALTAMTTMFVQLGVAMKVFSLIGTTGNMVKLTLMGAALILLATAIRILASAVAKLAEMNLGDMLRGLLGLTIMLRILSKTVQSMSGQSGGMIRSAAGLVILSLAIKLLVNSVKDLSEMSWEEMAKGLVGVGALLAALTLFTKFSDADKGGLTQGVGLILLATGIKILANAMKDMAAMSWQDIAKGLVGTAGGLTAIGLAMRLMPQTGILQAASIVVIAAALNLLGDALKNMAGMSWGDIGKGLATLMGALGGIAIALKLIPQGAIFSAASILIVATSLQLITTALQNMGAMSWEEIARGLVVLAGSLGIIAIALNLMQGTLLGAAALVVVTAALWALFPILMAFSQLSWSEVAIGLTMLAGAFTVIGLAGLILTPLIPSLLGLGAAILLLGLAVAAAGIGVMAFATGLTLLAAAGAAGTAAIVGIVSGLVGLIPMVMTQIGKGVVAFARVIAVSGPAIQGAITTVLNSFLDSIISVVPKAGHAFLVILNTILIVLVNAIPRLVDAGLRILIGFLDGIAKNIGKVVDKATDVIVNFLNGVSRNLPRIIQAGVDLIISFVNGMADAIRNNSDRMSEAGINLAKAIIQGMVTGIGNGLGAIIDAAKNLASSAFNAAMDFLDAKSPSKKFIAVGKFVVQGFVKGLEGGRDDIRKAVTDMLGKVNDAIASSRESISREEDKLKDIWAKRAENIHEVELAQKALNDARAREVGSTAKTAKARAAEIKRETDARNRAIASAEERLRRQTLQWKNYDDAVSKSQQTIAKYQGELNKLLGARTTLTKDLADENKHLQALAYSQEKLNDQIKVAKDRYADAKKTRDDYNKSILDQYGAQEKVTKDTHFDKYISNLEKQIVDTQKFSIAVQELRRRGLNAEMYKDLLAAGPEAAMGFVQETLAGGKGAIEQLNTLGSSLNTAAGKLGKSASTSLYQAGVDAAAGIVKGLQQQNAAIEKQMDKIAAYMVASIKRRLGIKSPSQVFAEIGNFAAEGLINGLTAQASAVGSSAETVGQSAVDSMRKTISGLGDLIGTDMEVNPVIAPVLDLSNVQKDAAQIGSLLDVAPISVDTTGARNASVAYAANQAAQATAATVPAPAPLTFIQNNTSPKALSSAEIYRQTNNQISVARGALTSNAR